MGKTDVIQRPRKLSGSPFAKMAYGLLVRDLLTWILKDSMQAEMIRTQSSCHALTLDPILPNSFRRPRSFLVPRNERGRRNE